MRMRRAPGHREVNLVLGGNPIPVQLLPALPDLWLRLDEIEGAA